MHFLLVLFVLCLLIQEVGHNGLLCATLEARASGFLKYQNFDRTTISDKQLYRETSATRQLCLRYDSSAPTHCSTSRTCNSRPIRVGEHVTNSANVHVTVSDWTDPVPTSADSNRASGIEKMTLTLHHVTHASMSQLLVSHDALTTLDVTNGTGDVILPREPALYALELEVKDRAHNVRVARTLVLFDNSSRLEVKSDRKINVTTASWRERGFWQTTGSEFCFSWTGRFYNTFHSESNFLLPLKPDPRGLVSGPYEHPGPLLPTNGTPNVDGVTSFSYNVRVNSASVQGETTLGEVQGQAACFTRATDDGDFVQMTVTATDVMGHVKSDLVGMHVDRSAPEVSLVSRATGLENSLFVHGVRDLSSLQVRLEALDPHSGLVNLRWTLGHRESPGNIANGTWPSHRLANGTTCPASTPCYCPIVGACEFYNYTLSMERLLHDADHNRDYVFTVMAENVAGLRTEVRLGILVDISPPEPGTVLEGEGPAASQDLDFTSSDLIHVRWSGFLDHESGVFKYRVGVGPRCLTEEELSADLTSPSRGNTSSVQEVMGTVARFSLNAIGKFYASVIAYNKALMTSRPVCSDGFVRDITPPAFHNVTIRGVGTRERIACLGGGVYLLQRNATLVKLESTACSGKCRSPSNTPWLEVLPLANPSKKNAEASTTTCNTYSELFGTQPSLYIPNDNVFLDWDLQEEESQIQELQVGFGISASSPDLEDFHAAFSHRRYHRNHVGLPTATPLYLFLKAVNKAGLVADVTVGPLVVDETPPHVRRPFSVSTNSSTALLVVDPSDFMDEDEDVNLLDCVVRVGYGGGTLIQTPGHPLPRGVCPGSVQGSSRCYTASLAGMRQLAGEEVQDFFFLVEVHDLAGHAATTKSETFQSPSLLPPGHGRVYDLDPANPVPAEDVDFQMSSSQVCVGWDGFRSHDDVSLFVGVGTTAEKDNVKSFSLVQSSLSQTCLSGLHLQPHTHYVTTVKAVSLVGATLVSSDGFVVLTPSSFPSLLVRDGLGCGEKEKTSLTTVPGDKKTSTATAANLHPGLTYTLVSDGGLAFNVTSSDVVWIPSSRPAVSSAKSFLALSRAATFLVDSTNTSLKLIECHEDREYTWQNSLSGYWNTLGSLTILPTHFSVSLRKNICAAKELTGACMDILTGFEDVGNTFRHTFPEMTLTADSTYHVAVRPCFGHLCGDASLSNGVQFHPYPASSAAVVLSQEVLNSSCFSVSLHWEPFHCGTIAAPYYHVTLKEVNGSNGQQTVFLSRGVTVINQSDRNIKSECWTRPASSVWAVRGCVWGVCPSGQEVTTCHLLTPEPNLTPLYDLDAKKRSPHDAISRHGNEGSDARASRLRMEDVDFLQSRVTLGAVLDQDWQGAVDWFLMVGSAVPGGKCDADPTCVHRTSTSAKTVVLQEMTLQDGQRYRICARRSIPGHSDNQTAATTCSDGFLVDDVPPGPPQSCVW